MSEQVGSDVGFAAMSAAGTVYTWGTGIVLPTRMSSGEFQVRDQGLRSRSRDGAEGGRCRVSSFDFGFVFGTLGIQAGSIWAERTCFAAISTAGKLQRLRDQGRVLMVGGLGCTSGQLSLRRNRSGRDSENNRRFD